MLLRPVRRPEDLAGLERLFAIISECDGHAPIGEHKYLDLLHAAPEQITGLIAEVDGAPAAYVAVGPTQQPGTWAIELALHPLHRNRRNTMLLVDAGVGRAGEAGADRVRCWAFLPNVVAVLEEAGFEPERELRQLRLDLPVRERPVFPSGVEVRPFVVGEDEDAWLEANNAAFEGHPENGGWTLEVLNDREREAWFDADGFRLAWQGAELVGFCWTKAHADESGEIYVVAVTPAARSRGLGRAMVLEGLRHLGEDRGLAKAMLYVDSNNEAAISLYSALGFRLDHVDRALARRL